MGGQQVRLFCAGYQADRSEEITGALVALRGSGGSTRLRLVARNHDPGGGRTLGMTVRRGDGTPIVDERHGTAGFESSELPESPPDPSTGWTTFYDRTIELDLREPAPGPPPPTPQPDPGSTPSGPDDHDWDLDEDPWFDDDGESPDGRRNRRVGSCRGVARRLALARRRAARRGHRLDAERRRLVGRRRSLEARGWPAREVRAYRSALRAHRRRSRGLRRLDRRVRVLSGRRERACR